MSRRSARRADLLLIYGPVPQPLPMPRTRFGMVPLNRATRQREGLDWIYSYWDRDWTPLYVGIAFDVMRRAQDHRHHTDWWRFVAFGGAVSCAEEDSRDLERKLIHRLHPLFNDKHSRLPWSTTVEYLAWREAWTLVDKYAGRVETSPDVNPEGQDRAGLDREEQGNTHDEESDRSDEYAALCGDDSPDRWAS